MEGKRDTDAEALAEDGQGGLIVAFERRHRLWRYRRDGSPPEEIPPPPQLYLAPSNDGVEALARLGDGRLLALTEGFQVAGPKGPGVAGWIRRGGTWEMFTYASDGRYKPTAAATLPGGDVVVLERRFTLIEGASVRVRRVAAEAVLGGERLESSRLADLVAPLTVDNFEGVAAREGEGGETLIYLISDDNYQATQRTLLMMFEVLDNSKV